MLGVPWLAWASLGWSGLVWASLGYAGLVWAASQPDSQPSQPSSRPASQPANQQFNFVRTFGFQFFLILRSILKVTSIGFPLVYIWFCKKIIQCSLFRSVRINGFALFYKLSWLSDVSPACGQNAQKAYKTKQIHWFGASGLMHKCIVFKKII